MLKSEVNQWLQEGIAAAKAGQLEKARFRLLDVVEQDQTNETAWYWLYRVFDRKDDRRTCLENLIILNPKNNWAKQELLNLLDIAPEQQPPLIAKTLAQTKLARPVTLKLVTAFWAGISIIFLAGGIISCGAWLFSRVENQLPQSQQIFYSLELIIGISFIVAGTVGLYVALMLFLQSMIGFYGSLLLALSLLLVGPTISLITSPPNYITMICTGGISGMIVLLTLASQPGFETISQDDNQQDPA